MDDTPLRAELGVFGEPVDPLANVAGRAGVVDVPGVARGEFSRGTPTRARGERAGSARGAVSSSATRLLIVKWRVRVRVWVRGWG
jgi:hypothetical protein